MWLSKYVFTRTRAWIASFLTITRTYPETSWATRVELRCTWSSTSPAWEFSFERCLTHRECCEYEESVTGIFYSRSLQANISASYCFISMLRFIECEIHHCEVSWCISKCLPCIGHYACPIVLEDEYIFRFISVVSSCSSHNSVYLESEWEGSGFSAWVEELTIDEAEWTPSERYYCFGGFLLCKKRFLTYSIISTLCEDRLYTSSFIESDFLHPEIDSIIAWECDCLSSNECLVGEWLYYSSGLSFLCFFLLFEELHMFFIFLHDDS